MNNNPAYNSDGSAKYHDKDGCPVFPPGSSGREVDTRYQHQTYRVRCYRWWRFKLPYKFYAVFCIIRWVLQGAPSARLEDDDFDIVLSRRETGVLVWRAARAYGEMKSQHHYTTKEMLDRM